MQIADKATIETDMKGWFTFRVTALNYDAGMKCFFFIYQNALHYLPRERVKIIKETIRARDEEY